MTEVGPFRLIDPPESQAQVVLDVQDEDDLT